MDYKPCYRHLNIRRIYIRLHSISVRIKLNGRELFEGDSIGALTVREITPEQSVLDFDGYEFSLKALQDWPQ